MSNQLILRSTNLNPLSYEQIKKFSPAIFSNTAHSGVSERYGMVHTYKILEAMHAHGFVPVEVRNYMRRDPANMQFTKHMIRFRQAGKLETRTVGDVVPQVVMLNAHDRSSRYELYGGLYRLICSNGMLASEGTSIEPIILRHTHNLVENVVTESEAIIKRNKMIFDYLDKMRKIKLTDKQALQFASRALELRVSRPGVLEPASLLVPRRNEDKSNDVWSVYNRVQENMIKGGIEGHTANGRRVVTTEIRSINADMQLNSGLWALAMHTITKAMQSSRKAVKEIAHV